MLVCSSARRSRTFTSRNGSDCFTQYFERVLCRPSRRPPHDQTWPWQDHQHRLCAERTRAAGNRALHGYEGGGEEPDPRYVRRLARYGLQINAIAPGYFKTPLNQTLVDNSEFSSWLEKRTPAGRWGNVDELVGAAGGATPSGLSRL